LLSWGKSNISAFAYPEWLWSCAADMPIFFRTVMRSNPESFIACLFVHAMLPVKPKENPFSSMEYRELWLLCQTKSGIRQLITSPVGVIFSMEP
jgi:hypothetical protein